MGISIIFAAHYLHFMRMRARFITLHLDSVGFFASLSCAIHCALLPLLLVVLPVAGLDFLLGPEVELALVGGSALLAMLTVAGAIQKNQLRKSVPLTMAVGFSSILVGVLAAPSVAVEVVCTSVGGILVAVGHYLNWRNGHRH